MANLGFHESSVVDFRIVEDKIIVGLDDVSSNKSKIKVRIEIEGVSRILIDSESTDMVTMPAPDGEILSLEIGDSDLFALIEWNDFSKSDSFTHSYDVKGEKIKVVLI